MYLLVLTIIALVNGRYLCVHPGSDKKGDRKIPPPKKIYTKNQSHSFNEEILASLARASKRISNYIILLEMLHVDMYKH